MGSWEHAATSGGVGWGRGGRNRRRRRPRWPPEFGRGRTRRCGALEGKRKALRAPERAANLVTCSGASWGDPGHGSAMAGGEEQSAAVEKEARG